jgi:hypothetical protein
MFPSLIWPGTLSPCKSFAEPANKSVIRVREAKEHHKETTTTIIINVKQEHHINIVLFAHI